MELVYLVGILLLDKCIDKLIDKSVDWVIEKVTDSFGNTVSQIVAVFDDDGDGVTDREEVIYSFDLSIPDLSNGFALVNRADEIGIGLPLLEPMDSEYVTSLIDTSLTGNGRGYRIDGEVYIPLDFDFSGDGINDWGRVVDSDNNGIPDASEDAPFYPVGSEQYNNIVSSIEHGGKSFIIVSPDGTMTIYDENGQITDEDCETAYKIWVSDNNIMSKPLDWYTPTEGLLFLTFIVSLFGFFGSIFRRRKVM